MAFARRRVDPWLGGLALSALLVTALDCFLLQKKYSAFTGGFLHPRWIDGGEVPLFLLGSLWLDASVAVLFLGPALWLTARFRRLAQARRLLVTVGICTLPLCAAMAYRYGADVYAGDLVQVTLPAAAALPARAVGSFALLLAGSLCFCTAWRLSRDVPDRAVGWLYRAGGPRVILALLAGAPIVLAATGAAAPDVHSQLCRKTAGAWMGRIGEALTDFDSDGAGLVRQPFDFAPFDPRRYPYAVDAPGNGIDENGVGGDLDAAGDFAKERYGPVRFVRRPDVVVLVLESFRADNLDATLDGRAVTPVLRRLVAEGALTGPAYSHNGYTVESHAHLFGGRLAGDGDTLVDDFLANGYLTACISGQDETFGRLARLTGLVRAEHFVDARADRSERTSVSSAPGALTVPWTVVVRNVRRFLTSHGPDPRPLFCYVNLQDCHFPYGHDAMEPVFLRRPLPRARIAKENTRLVRRAYLNAAANVDKAIGEILAAFAARRAAPPAFVILGDHGESLFDDGMLGHGLEPCAAQTKIPFLASGLPVTVVFPIGQSEVRALVRDALARPDAAAASARTDPSKWVWQYTNSPDRPGFLGAAGARGGIRFDVRARRWTTWGEPPLAAPSDELVRLWERIALHRAKAATAR